MLVLTETFDTIAAIIVGVAAIGSLAAYRRWAIGPKTIPAAAILAASLYLAVRVVTV